MEENCSKEELQPMFRALEEFIENHPPLNETFLTELFCANSICLGCQHALIQPFLYSH